MENGRVALVSGGNRGIGLEVCRQLAQRGYTVVMGSRDDKQGRAAAALPCSPSREPMTTVIPRSGSCRQTSSPIPRFPPLTSAIRPLSISETSIS